MFQRFGMTASMHCNRYHGNRIQSYFWTKNYLFYTVHFLDQGLSTWIRSSSSSGGLSHHLLADHEIRNSRDGLSKGILIWAPYDLSLIAGFSWKEKLLFCCHHRKRWMSPYPNPRGCNFISFSLKIGHRLHFLQQNISKSCHQKWN